MLFKTFLRRNDIYTAHNCFSQIKWSNPTKTELKNIFWRKKTLPKEHTSNILMDKRVENDLNVYKDYGKTYQQI